MLLKGDICRGDTAYIAYTDDTIAPDDNDK